MYGIGGTPWHHGSDFLFISGPKGVFKFFQLLTPIDLKAGVYVFDLSPSGVNLPGAQGFALSSRGLFSIINFTDPLLVTKL